MKLFAVVAFGFVALAASEVYPLHQHGGGQQYQVGDSFQERISDYQHGPPPPSSMHQRGYYHDDQAAYQPTYSQPRGFGQTDDYSESSWNAQAGQAGHGFPQPYGAENKFSGGGYGGNQEEFGQWKQPQQQYGGKPQQYGADDQQFNRQYAAYGARFGGSPSTYDDDFESDEFSSYSTTGYPSEFDTQDDYIKDQSESGDIANEIGRKVAQKMVKFFNIVQKFAARNGTVPTYLAQDPLSFRQWALPMKHHQYLNMNECKVYGLSQGIFKSMDLYTDKNSVDLYYYFNNLFVNGNLKASMGAAKGPFDLKIFNTDVTVSTELENRNRNRNYASTRNGNIEFNGHSLQDASSSDYKSIAENMEGKYVQFVDRAIESELIGKSYDGLVGCLRSEIKYTFDMPASANPSLVIENKKAQLTVTFTRSQSWATEPEYKERQVQYVGFRQNKSGNGGYKLKVKVILAKNPTWQSDVYVQKHHHQQFTISNVNFAAKYIVATAVMERVQKSDGGEYKFNVKDAAIKLDGLKYDIGKFDLPKGDQYEKLAREVGQNLHKIIENGMSAALQQQLYEQQQICQDSQMDCVRCGQGNY